MPKRRKESRMTKSRMTKSREMYIKVFVGGYRAAEGFLSKTNCVFCACSRLQAGFDML